MHVLAEDFHARFNSRMTFHCSSTINSLGSVCGGMSTQSSFWLSCYFVTRALHKRIWQIDFNHGLVPHLARHCLSQEGETCPGGKFLFSSVFLATREAYDAVRGAANNCRVLCTHWKKGTLLYKLLFPLEDNFLQKINCQSSEKCYRWDISLGEGAWLTLNTNQASKLWSSILQSLASRSLSNWFSYHFYFRKYKNRWWKKSSALNYLPLTLLASNYLGWESSHLMAVPTSHLACSFQLHFPGSFCS